MMFRHSDFNRTLVSADHSVAPVFALIDIAKGAGQINETTPRMAVSTFWPFAPIKRSWREWANDRHMRLSITRLQGLSEHLLADAGLTNDVAMTAPKDSLTEVKLRNSQQF